MIVNTRNVKFRKPHRLTEREKLSKKCQRAMKKNRKEDGDADDFIRLAVSLYKAESKIARRNKT